MKNFFVLLLLFIGNTQAHCQIPTWLNTINGSGRDHVYCVDYDNQGNVYACGRFTGAVDFDPSPSSYMLTSNGLTDCFLAKYTSTGSLLWAFNIGAYEKDAATKVIVNNAGEVLVAGCFRGSADFDPSASAFFMNATGLGGTDNLDIPGGDIFLAKYSNMGNFIWAFMISGGYLHDKPEGLDVDLNDNIYLAGAVNSTSPTPIDADPGPGFYDLSGQGNAFVAKYTTNGNFNWAFNYGGYGLNSGVEELKVLPNDTAFVIAGFFDGINIDFDPGPGTVSHTSNGVEDLVFAKYSFNKQFMWLHTDGDISTDLGEDLDIDEDNNIYITGWFNGTNVDFDPSSNAAPLTANGLFDAFIVKYTDDGQYVWAKGFGGTALDAGYTIYVREDKLYTGGYFWNTADFDPGPSTFNMTSAGGSDIYLSTFDTAGNFICANQIGGLDDEMITEISGNAADTILICGRYATNNVDFDPTASSLVYPNAGAEDGFLGVYSYSISSSTTNFTLLGDTICNGAIPSVIINSNPIISGSYSVNYTVNGITYTANGVSNGIPFPLQGTYNTNTTVTINSIQSSVSGLCAILSFTLNQNVPIVVQVPTITAVAAPPIICLGQSTTLTASGGVSYVWSGGITNGVPFTPTSSSTYTVIGTDASGCTATSTVSVTVSSSSMISASASPSILCLGGSCVLTAVGATTYTWTGGVTNGVPFTPTSTTTYTVIGTDANDCTGTSQVTVTVQPPPTITITGPTQFCIGDTLILSASGALTYLWSPANTLSASTGSTVSAFPSNTTTYTVTGITSLGCSATQTFTMELDSVLNVQISKSNDITCHNPTCVLTATGANTYKWSPAHVLSNTSGSSTTATVTQSVYVTVVGSTGACHGSDTILLDILPQSGRRIFIPNAFSPNDDNVNDCLQVVTNELFDEFKFVIYNRWGQKVWEADNQQSCWNGFFKNERAPLATYYYYLKVKSACGEYFTKGDVILLR